MSDEIRQLRRELAELQEEVSVLRARIAVLESDQFEVVLSAASAASSSSGYTDSDGLVRTEAAEETGRYFLRCLEGSRRGLSGRERVKLGNRVYVLIRDINGVVITDPVRVIYTYSELKPLVSRGSTFGDSIFAGFASKWEVRIAVATAGFRWPA